jgi:hypothetical protein
MSSATSAASKNIVEVFAISIVLAGVVASLLHKLSASLVHLSPRARFKRQVLYKKTAISSSCGIKNFKVRMRFTRAYLKSINSTLHL